MGHNLSQIIASLSTNDGGAIVIPQQQASVFPHLLVCPIDNDNVLISWHQFIQLLDVVIIQLQQYISSQQGIAIIRSNDFLSILLYLGSLACGARVMVINPAFSKDKIEDILTQYQLSFYYSDHHYDVRTSLALDISLLCSNTDDLISKKIVNTTYDTKSAVEYDWERGRTMTLTSGTTGLPKAVVHNIQAHLDNAQGVCKALEFSSKKSWLLTLPLYHVSGQAIVWRWLLQGAQLRLVNQSLYNELDTVTHVSLVPTQLQRYLKRRYINQREDSHASCLETVLLGGAPISSRLCQQAQSSGINVYPSYGMTEMASTVYIESLKITKNIGLLSNRHLKVVDQEIWVKGAGLALGYWQNGTIINCVNAEGWYQTKDRGLLSDGKLSILGRLDNMFISGGENIYPEEIEQIIMQHSSVIAVYIVPDVDDELGKKPVAFICFEHQFSQNKVNDIRQWLINRIEKFKQPVCYYPLPQQWINNASIKISRHELLLRLQELKK